MMSSSRKSGSVCSNSLRNSGMLRDTRRPAGPVCHTLRNQTQSKPISARRSSSASGMSSSVARLPRTWDSSVNQTRVLIWYSAGECGPDMLPPSLLACLLSAHLFPDDPGHDAPAFGLQDRLGVETPKKVQESGHHRGPSRLVAGPKTRAVVTVEIFVKQNQ